MLLPLPAPTSGLVLLPLPASTSGLVRLPLKVPTPTRATTTESTDSNTCYYHGNTDSNTSATTTA
nr:CBM_HP1_G0014190.mRNA.1.CDS.1 [Saccharomyces cerevisiae]